MIEFDYNLLSHDIVKLKKASGALGGSLTIDVSTDKDVEILEKISVPFAVVRNFITRNQNVSTYLDAVPLSIIKYDNRVIAMEVSPYGNIDTGEEWHPTTKRMMDTLIDTIAETNYEWYIDGRYIYSFDDELEDSVKDGEPLSSDGLFTKVSTTSIDTMMLYEPKLYVDTRYAVGFHDGENWSVTPPIWKGAIITLDSSEKESRDDGFVEESTVTIIKDEDFYKADEVLNVNLHFALKAAATINELFDFESIEPLKLAEVMIELNTINLPKLDNGIKKYFKVGMDFSFAFAWLMGFVKKCETLDELIEIRSLLRYLTTRGIVNVGSTDNRNIFLTDDPVPPLLKIA